MVVDEIGTSKEADFCAIDHHGGDHADFTGIGTDYQEFEFEVPTKFRPPDFLPRQLIEEGPFRALLEQVLPVICQTFECALLNPDTTTSQICDCSL